MPKPTIVRVVRSRPADEQAALIEAFRALFTEALAAGLAELRAEMREAVRSVEPPQVTFAPGAIVVNIEPAAVNVQTPPLTIEAKFSAQPAPIVKIESGAIQVNNTMPEGDIEMVYDSQGRVTGTRRT